MVLGVSTELSLRGATSEVVLAPPATCQVLFPGFTIQPLDGGPLLAFPAGAAPPSLLAALHALARGDLPGEGKGPEPQAGEPDHGVELDVDEDNEYLRS